MRLAGQGALFFGLKVGRRSADLVLVDFLGKIRARRRQTYQYPNPEETLRFVENGVRSLTDSLVPEETSRIAGLGIALPGFLWEWARQVGVSPENLEAWRGRDLRAEISELFPFPVFLENDATCACSAELVFGARATPPDFLYLYVGHLIGGGLVLQGELFPGRKGNAGVIGPLPVPRDGGGVQQLVDVASLSGLEADLTATGADGSGLWTGTGHWDINPGILDSWIDRAAHGIAYAVTAACSFIDFELVLIDGWLPPDVRAALVSRTIQLLPGMDWAGLVFPEIAEGTIGPDAKALGAASLPLSQRFLVSSAQLIEDA
jgi:predicted NBD/HSP70 family sugar kinase